MIRALNTLARSMLLNAEVPLRFWTEAISTASYLHRRMPQPSLANKSPHELLFGVEPKVHHLKRFGCTVYRHLTKDQWSDPKFGARSRPCMFLGYVHATTKCWRIWDFEMNRAVPHSNVVFREHQNAAEAVPIQLTGQEIEAESDGLFPIGTTFDEATEEGPNLVDAPRALHTALGEETSGLLHSAPGDALLNAAPGDEGTGMYQPMHDAHESADTVLETATPKSNTAPGNALSNAAPSDEDTETTTSQSGLLGGQRLASAQRRQRNAKLVQEMLDGMGNQNVVNLSTMIDILTLSSADPLDDEGPDAKDSQPRRDPTTWKEAMSRPDAHKCQEAIKKEQTSIMENGTFYTADQHTADQHTASRATGRKPLSTKYHFKTKLGSKGEIIYKVRLVVRGFEQIPDLEFEDTYAPVSKLTSLRLLVAMTTQYDWKLTHLDVKAAFLNPILDRDNIYVTLPKGTAWIADGDTMEIPSSRVIPSIAGYPPMLWLRKALYGLKQSGYLWHQLIDDFLRLLGLEASAEEPNLYIGTDVLLLLYVDDILVADRTNMDISNTRISALTPAELIIEKLMERFNMVNLGDAKKFVGMELVKRADGYDLHQEGYIDSMLDRYGQANAAGYITPTDTHVDLFRSKNVEDRELDDRQKKLYQAMVGSLMYAAQGSRPDISFAVTTLSRFNAQPLTCHMTAARRVLRYLKTTRSLGLRYTRTPNNDPYALLFGRCDSDWAGYGKDRKSVGGMVFLFGTYSDDDDAPTNTGPISWQSKRQTVVAGSTLEAEFISCSNTAREADWLRRLHTDMLQLGPNNTYRTSMKIGCDNQGAVARIEDGKFTKLTKHIDVKYRHAVDVHKSAHVQFRYIGTKDNAADILTKGLPPDSHKGMIELLGMKKDE